MTTQAIYLKDKIDRYIEARQEGKTIGESAIFAGYSKSVALSKTKWLEAQATARIKERIADMPKAEVKRTMAEIVGFTKEDVFENIRHLATQERDYGVRLKVITPLAKEYDVDLSGVDTNITIPVLNMNVSNTPRTLNASRTIERTSIDDDVAK